MEFHELLVELMNAKGVNQAQLCKATGIASSAMSHYVRGETDPSFTKAIKIARALDVPIDALADRNQEIIYSFFDTSKKQKKTEEDELVEIYRSLDKKGKKHLMVFARGCAASYKK